ncbi:MAG: DinB family protein [Gemmatimonadales bacterium]
MTRFADIPDLVLASLAGRPEVDWHRAPPGKWSAGQIVHHLAIGLDSTSQAFESRRDRPPMRRRRRTPSQRLAHFLILRLGWQPRGAEAPAGVRPAERPQRAAVERQFREGFARFLRLERELLPARRSDLFVKHPVLGDLTLPEWLRFHEWHCAHHAKQIRARLEA